MENDDLRREILWKEWDVVCDDNKMVETDFIISLVVTAVAGFLISNFVDDETGDSGHGLSARVLRPELSFDVGPYTLVYFMIFCIMFFLCRLFRVLKFLLFDGGMLLLHEPLMNGDLLV